MVAIHKTISMLKIETLIENKVVMNDFRPWLGASVVGNACARYIWYAFHWSYQIKISPRMKRLFDRGHMEELQVIEDLIAAGCTVENANIDKSIHNRFKTIFGVTLPDIPTDRVSFASGHGSGTRDAVIHNLPDAPLTPHLLEVKTANERNFSKMVIIAKVETGKPQHFVQCQVYMKLYGLVRCLYVMVNKNTDARYYERIRYDKSVADTAVRKAEYIINQEMPPARISHAEENAPCIFCDYRPICFGSAPAHRSCRTCQSCEANDGGAWYCKVKKKDRSFDKQVKGCKHYGVSRAFSF